MNESTDSIQILTSHDPAYPQRLSQRLGSDAPPLTILGSTNWIDGTAHPMVALFSSVKAPARAILQAHELAQQWRTEPITIVSGFQSPLEKEVWSVLIRDIVSPHAAPPEQVGPRLVKVLARGMVKRLSPQEQHGVTMGDVVLVSPFDEQVRRATRQMAFTRNLVAAALADRIVVGHAEEGGSTARLVEVVEGWGMGVEVV